jgi:hypothetical protein
MILHYTVSTTLLCGVRKAVCFSSLAPTPLGLALSQRDRQAQYVYVYVYGWYYTHNHNTDKRRAIMNWEKTKMKRIPGMQTGS